MADEAAGEEGSSEAVDGEASTMAEAARARISWRLPNSSSREAWTVGSEGMTMGLVLAGLTRLRGVGAGGRVSRDPRASNGPVG